MRQFERQFQVDGDVARNRSMDRWIGNNVPTTLPLKVFTQRNFVADFFSTEVEFYWHKQRYRVFVPPFGDLGVTYMVYLWLVGKRVVDFL